MIIDRHLTVSGALTLGGNPTGQQARTIAAPIVSTDSIDLSSARDIGEGRDVYAVFTVVESAYNNITSLTFEVIVADNDALTTNVTVIASSGAVPVASLTQGAQFVVAVPPLIASLGRRYLGARYTLAGGGNSTGGAILATFALDVQDGRTFYARNDNP